MWPINPACYFIVTWFSFLFFIYFPSLFIRRSNLLKNYIFMLLLSSFLI